MARLDGQSSCGRAPFRLAKIATVALLGLSTSACFSPAIILGGQKKTSTQSPSAPTVSDLVDHIACELGKTYEENVSIEGADSASKEHAARWQHLKAGNFVVSVDLTLLVTRAEGFNPSFSAITPLTGAGVYIPSYKIVYSGMNQTSGTYNDTLAVGFQLNSTADRNVEQDFTIDMRSLINEYEAAHEPQAAVPAGIDPRRFPYCGGRDGRSLAVSRSPLNGNMELLETIEDGLIAIDRSARYNLYGTSGPTSLSAVVPSNNAMTLGSNPQAALVAAANGAGSPPSGGGGASSAAKTTFGSKVDFFISWGINGGYSVSTLDWKVGAGGGGGSGGGGGGGSGGGGGGGGGGSGGGGGGQILSATRTTQDSLTVTFGATCESSLEAESPVALPLRGGPTQQQSDAPFNVLIPAQTAGAPSYRLSITLPLFASQQKFDPGVFATTGSQLWDTVRAEIDGHETAVGAVQWSGYVLKGGEFSYRGIVTSGLTGQTVGIIWFTSKRLEDGSIDTQDIVLLHFPRSLNSALNDVPPSSYWDSIPSCDTLTAAQKQSAINAVESQNQFQTFFR